MHDPNLEQYRAEVAQALEDILTFWLTQTPDLIHGGFIGRMDIEGRTDPAAPKGLVLNARILWSFSAAYAHVRDPRLLDAAHRALQALRVFEDSEWGGYYWSTQADGAPLNTRKQMYGQAFALYGLSEYYKITQAPEILAQCHALFAWIERHSFQQSSGGYWEAVARDGSPLDDLRLSPKDLNAPLSMNTHLHVLEAYVNFYRVAPSEQLGAPLRHLIDLFLQRIYDADHHTLHLFFEADWTPVPADISYGHDIETAWLLQDAAEAIAYRVEACRRVAVDVAQAVLPALDAAGGLDYESQRRERHWWVQAEAMVGFLNAYQESGNPLFLEKSMLCWDFTQKHMIDRVHGEWYWGYTAGGELMRSEDKVGFWKCPYHNVRACIEIIRRVSEIVQTTDP